MRICIYVYSVVYMYMYIVWTRNLSDMKVHNFVHTAGNKHEPQSCLRHASVNNTSCHKVNPIALVPPRIQSRPSQRHSGGHVEWISTDIFWSTFLHISLNIHIYTRISISVAPLLSSLIWILIWRRRIVRASVLNLWWRGIKTGKKAAVPLQKYVDCACCHLGISILYLAHRLFLMGAIYIIIYTSFYPRSSRIYIS